MATLLLITSLEIMKLHIVTTKSDPRGILKRDLSNQVEKPENMKQYRTEMMRLCREFRGIGLAANQAGLAHNMFIVMPGAKLLPSNTAELVINPKWEPHPEAVSFESVEGCLSLPGRMFKVSRWSMINASWHDVSGQRKEQVLKGMAAKVFQHESDHLRGLTLEQTSIEEGL